MKNISRVLFLGLCLLGVPLATSGPAHAQDPEPALRRFALVASSNDGGPSRLRLRFANSDARAVADVLRHLGGLRAEDLVLLPGATRASLQGGFERLRSIIAQAPRGKSRREILVYYSGHSDESGLLLAGDHVRYQELRQWLEATDSDVRIAILDSCSSGALLRSRGGTRRPSFLNDVSVNARGHAFLTASSADEAAQESDRIGAAFFTHYLVSGLRGAADASRDGRVTLAEAYQFAYHETLGRTAQTVAGPQHPAYDIQLAGTGDLVLTDLRATNARLLLEQSLAGRVYVRDTSGRLLIELRKEAVHPVELALAAGEYRVSIDRDGRHYQALVSLADGKSTNLSVSELQTTKPLLAATRGEPGPQNAADSTPSAAQEPSLAQTLIGETSLIGQTRELGGYAGIGFHYTELGQTDGMLATLEGALLINRRYAVGLAIGGGVSGEVDDADNSMAFGYAGILARYYFSFDSPLGLSLGAIAGAGGAQLTRETSDQEQADDDAPSDAVFVFEPQLGGHVDITRFLRLGVSVGHRFVAGAEVYPTRDIRGFTAGLNAQLGWF